MNAGLIVRSAGTALLRNLMRTFLTAIGVVIGVAAVIAMVAIGEGAKRQATKVVVLGQTVVDHIWGAGYDPIEALRFE